MSFYLYKDTAGQWRWYLKASNGEKIAVSSESYYNKQDAKHAIDLVKSAYNAPVYEV